MQVDTLELNKYNEMIKKPSVKEKNSRHNKIHVRGLGCSFIHSNVFEKK